LQRPLSHQRQQHRQAAERQGVIVRAHGDIVFVCPATYPALLLLIRIRILAVSLFPALLLLLLSVLGCLRVDVGVGTHTASTKALLKNRNARSNNVLLQSAKSNNGPSKRKHYKRMVTNPALTTLVFAYVWFEDPLVE
jgi:hypothetical protein